MLDVMVSQNWVRVFAVEASRTFKVWWIIEAVRGPSRRRPSNLLNGLAHLCTSGAWVAPRPNTRGVRRASYTILYCGSATAGGAGAGAGAPETIAKAAAAARPARKIAFTLALAFVRSFTGANIKLTYLRVVTGEGPFRPPSKAARIGCDHFRSQRCSPATRSGAHDEGGGPGPDGRDRVAPSIACETSAQRSNRLRGFRPSRFLASFHALRLNECLDLVGDACRISVT
ncbi:hypothetical protein EVAR_58851_1 [Eumeta japonica]|uniref:Uncharacterized protein n=1 Tax=Eumeta variegata TaxID=151549 RepID=A0A4C1YBB6_EUMVA|nr:hypothetical protein EVAR_58851_1 [Eumeta japonica]